jgi:hypothetical protein
MYNIYEIEICRHCPYNQITESKGKLWEPAFLLNPRVIVMCICERATGVAGRY